MSDAVKDFFEEQATLLSGSEIVDRIVRSARELRKKQNAVSLEKEIEEVVSAIGKDVIACHHPIVKKLLDWGYLKGRNKYICELKAMVCELLKKEYEKEGSISLEDVKKLDEAIEEYKEWVIENVRKIIEGA